MALSHGVGPQEEKGKMALQQERLFPFLRALEMAEP